MKRKNITAILAAGMLSLYSTAYAQEGRVGINTTDPKTTLDVTGKTDTSGNLLTTDMTGLQAPRLTRAELTAKGNTLYGVNQKGALVYITDVSGGDADATSQRKNISAVGYYYFDGTVWQAVANGASAAATEPWYNVATNAGATANTQDIYQMGNVGINDVNPFAKLTVRETQTDKIAGLFASNIKSSSSDFASTLSVNGGFNDTNDVTTTTNKARIDLGTDTAMRAQVEAGRDTNSANGLGGYLSFRTRNSSTAPYFFERMRIDTNGNVGIGTNTPNAKLKIVSDAATDWLKAGASMETYSDANIHSYFEQKSYTGNLSAPGYLSLDRAMGAVVFRSLVGEASVYGRSDDAHSATAQGTRLDFAITNTSGVQSVAMTIKKTGNVGIGTATPIEKLEVNGNSHLLGTVNDYKIIGNHDGTNYFIGQYPVPASAGLNISWHGGIRLSTRDGVGVQVLQNGNVGIGTTTPGTKLAVVGLPVYADNEAATTAGLQAGDFYRTASGVVMVRY